DLSRQDPKNTAALYHRAIVYRSLGIVHGYAGQNAAAVQSFADGVKIYDELIEHDAANQSYPMFRAELQARMTPMLTGLTRSDEARRVGEAGIRFMVQRARRQDANASQLHDAARYLMETKVPSIRSPKLALEFAERAARISSGADAGVFESLAEAYALNGNPVAAAETIRKALALLPPLQQGEKPSRARQGYLDQLAKYELDAGNGR